jgi:hypothetical protein
MDSKLKGQPQEGADARTLADDCKTLADNPAALKERQG